MKKHEFILLILFLLKLNLFSQLGFSKWYFGYYGAFDFTTNPPTQLSGSALLTAEGCASIADASGNLLFYTNGSTIYNSLNAVMANGTGLNGNQSTTQSAVIVKQPGSASLYYVFTLDQAVANNIGAFYSIVDMSLAAGQGSVISKNNFLYSQCLEKQVAIRHCNGKDVWIVSHEASNNNFVAYLLTAAGLNPNPVVSSIGDVIYGIGAQGAGEMKASPDGKKIACAILSPGIGTVVPPYGFHLFDFDATSGVLSNSLTLLNTTMAYGVEFSQDGTKLYGTRRGLSAAPTSTLCQWNVCSTTSTAILNSLYTTTLPGICNSLKLAINNKIYIAVVGTATNPGLHIINNPNNAGLGMNLAIHGLTTNTAGGCSEGLPNYITGYTKPQNPQISSTVNCQQVLFNAPSYTTTYGCSNLPYPTNGYLWDFGDPGSGAANSSTLDMAEHFYNNLGSYTVTLVVYSNCENDTIKKVINITIASPTINVAGTFTVCKGDKRTYSASGGTTYSWSMGTNTSTVSLSPTVNTVYTVTGTAANGCKASKQFTLTVNECLSLKSKEGQIEGVRLWPNPFNTTFNLEVKEATKIIIYDLQGRLVMQCVLESGINELSNTALQNGVYFIEGINKASNWQARLVKVE